jgi:hypothetical protein
MWWPSGAGDSRPGTRRAGRLGGLGPGLGRALERVCADVDRHMLLGDLAYSGAELGRVVEQTGPCVRYARLSSFEDALAEAHAPMHANQHDRLIALAEHDLEDRFNRADRSLSSEERDELNRLIECYGGRGRAFKAPWHRTSFGDCFELVKNRWAEEPEAGYYLDYIYDLIQRRNNLLLHGSPTAYRQTVTVDADGRVHLNRIGPDSLWSESLAQGAGGYYFVRRVLAQEFGFDREAVAEIFSRSTSYCRKADEFPDLAALPDGAACPCMSGRMVNHCHRS